MYPITVKCIKSNDDFNLICGQIYLGIVKRGLTGYAIVEIHLPHTPYQVYCSGQNFKEHFELDV